MREGNPDPTGAAEKARKGSQQSQKKSDVATLVGRGIHGKGEERILKIHRCKGKNREGRVKLTIYNPRSTQFSSETVSDRRRVGCTLKAKRRFLRNLWIFGKMN